MEQSIIGRDREKQILGRLLGSPRPEFLALYGRRRVGKTHLVNEFFEGKGILLEIVGSVETSRKVQLARFAVELANKFPKVPKDVSFESWDQAFQALVEATDEVLRREPKQQIVLFFDEAPWLDTRNSGFLSALTYAWNKNFSKSKYGNLLLIVCGSAASWIINKAINSKGGLHNRITETIRLEPFDLAEAKAFLESRGVQLEHRQIVEVYLALGGVAAYLGHVRPGLSATQIINELCFTSGRMLTGEFNRLFSSLFTNHHKHEQVVRALAAAPHGLDRETLLTKAGLSSGGVASRILNELEESGFIAAVPQHGKRKRGRRYRLIDEYSLFYIKWIAPALHDSLGRIDEHYWLRQTEKPSWLSWAGYAFEGLCLKNVDCIKRALGISGVSTTQSSWSHVPKPGEPGPGAQIDLIIDRADRTINLCEIKFVSGELEISAALRRDLERKKAVFREQTGTRSLLLTTLITAEGVKQGKNYHGVVDQQLTMDCLFVRG